MRKYISLLVFIGLTIASLTTNAQVGIITTVAGNGGYTYSMDGVPATSTPVAYPGSVARDRYGNMYITCENYNVVIKVDTFGVLHFFAGYYGSAGFSGDGGPATNAQFYGPIGIAIDTSGNVYIADAYNYRIRKVNTSGIITTIAGQTTSGYSGDGGPATLAQLNWPNDIALDQAGNIYFTDLMNNCVRKINTLGVITTVAGNGIMGFTGDGGPATSCQLARPNGLTVDDTGNIYIGDTYNYRVRKVNTAGIISTIAGSTYGFSGDGGPATAASLNLPWDVATDRNGNIYITDYCANRIRKINPYGIITTAAGTGVGACLSGSYYSGDGGPATAANITEPMGLILDSTGNNLYFADNHTLRVRKIRFDYSIGVSPNDSVCAGTAVTFFANSITGCTSPTYQWYLNGTIVGSTSNTYSYVPSNGDSVKCLMHCSGGVTDTSNIIHMVVRPVYTPTNHITSFSGDTVCAGTLVTFTSITTSGGASPTYKWYVNGALVSSGSSAAYAYVPSNGDHIYCQLLSSIPCAIPAVLSSNTITMHVDPILTPMVTITCSPGDTVCPGTSVTFTATSIGGGSIPFYQWRVNGVIVGSSTSTYTYIPSSGDSVKCILTSSSACATATTATSNVIAMIVRTVITPSITIHAYLGDSVCSGTAVTFIYTSAGGGATPSYQWRKNGVVVGSGSSYTYIPATGDSISCRLVSSALCEVGATVNSNTIHMTVETIAPSSISISVTPSDTICNGQSVVFNAIPVMGGTTPFFQWTRNGVPAGTGGSSYACIPANGDYVRCRLTSSDVCASPDTAISNTITIVADSLTTPSISLTGPAGANIGALVTVSATVAGAGSSYVIRWMNYGILFGTTTVPSVTYTKTSGIDVITARIVSTATGCYDSTTSNILLVDLPDDDGVKNVISSSVNIYPNPTDGTLHIDNALPGVYRLTNVVGITILQGTLTKGNNTVSLERLSPGVYLIEILTSEGGKTMVKIVRE